MNDIRGFFGEYRFLSNFTPATIKFEGDYYSSVEHAYVAAKTLSPRERELIRMVESAGKIKIIGRRLTLRPEWNKLRISFMRSFLEQKFNYPKYKELLLKTGSAYLEETNSWGDTFWGVSNGCGLNTLGQLLMSIRTSYQKYDKYTIEELVLLKEEQDDRLSVNPLDSSAQSRYNELCKVINQRQENA